MLKGLYFVKEELEEYSGVYKKINSQIKALERLGIEMELSYSVKKTKHYFRKIDNLTIDEFPHSFLGRMKKKFFYYNKLQDYILNKEFEFIYVRYNHFADRYFINFLKNLKSEGIKIFLEIPTYPYDEEIKDMKIKNILKEKKYRYKLKEYVDRIITFSEDDEIFGVKTIKINNGVDIENIKVVNKNKEQNNYEINFIGVAMISLWHGFDRMILSMAEYYKNNPKEIVRFHIVGDGDKKVVTELKDLVKKNNLEEHVMFYGYKSGKDLDEIYNKVDIAVGSLGFSRIGLKGGSPLKIREYIAKGVPIILGYEDISLKNTLDFIYQVPNDESVFDLYKILDWYKNLDKDSTKIRRYAEDNLTWDKQMKKVNDYILETREKEKC
ncbi:glycosyltransferase [Fusobacterium sp.]|uniref:glycosyltransferase n=1 Tax=Fusobacterium sp. TaxID=68766 RepID=UPI001DF90741|nr:glycosyltransferase [Fusobacterium sp.]MBS5790289.1 glycosyltransferase [Fusobacterium sp.]